MTAVDEFISYARAQREAEVDRLIAQIERIRTLDGLDLLRTVHVQFKKDDPGYAIANCLARGLLRVSSNVHMETISFVFVPPPPNSEEFVTISVNFGLSTHTWHILIDAFEERWKQAKILSEQPEHSVLPRYDGAEPPPPTQPIFDLKTKTWSLRGDGGAVLLEAIPGFPKEKP